MTVPLTAKTIDPAKGQFGVDYLRDSRGDDTTRHLARALQIATVLQTSLEVEKVVELFSAEVGKSIPHSSFGYQNESHGIQLTLGEPGRHGCSYRLVVAGQPVGQVSMTRASAFSHEETFALEYLLCSLVYPLLNALKYRDALDSALKDPLTGLSNRTVFDAALEREIKLSHRHGTWLSLVVVDIDDFKQINDSHGHARGDMVLRCVAQTMAACIRDTDVLARFGGEEFVLLLNNTDERGARLLAERIRSRIEEQSCDLDSMRLSVTVSLGVATASKSDSAASLFERSDRALYLAKSQGKNCVRFGTGAG